MSATDDGLAGNSIGPGGTARGEDPREDRGLNFATGDAAHGAVLAEPLAKEEGQSPLFSSILFEGPGRRKNVVEPAFFSDLNLDQIVEAVTADRAEYDLEPFFYDLLSDVEAIHYRHEVLADIDGTTVREHLTGFAQRMRDVRAHMAQAGKLHDNYQRESWSLDAIAIYCDAVRSLSDDLSSQDVRSRGLRAFGAYLARYVKSPWFAKMVADTVQLKQDLSEVSYTLHIKGSRITVRKYDSEADYSTEVLQTFERFKQGAVKDYRVRFDNRPEMNHVEARILGLVARLFNDTFAELDDYCVRYRAFLDVTIRDFDREVQFYLAYLDYMEQFKSVDLKFCYPKVSRQSKEISGNDTFDLALANKLVPQGSPVVCNDFYLKDSERILLVSGPNQGGKTTFARTFGQLHYLASIGYPVPGSDARLFVFDNLYTHFEKEEDLTNLSGKLEDDLVRIRDVLGDATTNSIVIMNEIFTSTTLQDARFLGGKVIEKIVELDALCVYVTFVDELASLSDSIVSMVSTVVPERPAQRTYKVVRGPANGLAYAIALAEKYGVTYDRLMERIVP